MSKASAIRKESAILGLAFAFVAAAALAGCGDEIGQGCSQHTDCAQDGSRICDVTSPDGYCTIEGCDFGTCPEGSICVRFFPVTQLTKSCTVTTDCAVDEICTIAGKCAPLETERRFCMATCDGHGDCRENYECRDVERMAAHGGEPVPDPSATRSEAPTSFCAPSQPCSAANPTCDLGDTCDLAERRCTR